MQVATTQISHVFATWLQDVSAIAGNRSGSENTVTNGQTEDSPDEKPSAIATQTVPETTESSKHTAQYHRTEIFQQASAQREAVEEKLQEASNTNRQPGYDATSADATGVDGADPAEKMEEAEGESTTDANSAPGELTEAEQQEVRELSARDAEVHTHEAAHMAAAGQYAQGGPSFDYQRGPDGKRYAVGGHVSISVSEASTPEKTISKMQTVQRAALAPAEPSSQDRQIASEAASKLAQAQKELTTERTESTRSEQIEDNEVGLSL